MRWDLTKGDRYTLSETSKSQAYKIQDAVKISVYLEGDFPAEFKQLQIETDQLLVEYRNANKAIRFEFVNPKSREQELQNLGMQPSILTVEKNGVFSEQTIFPFVEIRSEDKVEVVNLLKDNSTNNQIEQSISSLEYKFTNALAKLSDKKTKKIAVLSGNSESSDLLLYDLLSEVSQKYFLAKFTLDSAKTAAAKTLEQILEYDLLLISNPKETFTPSEKFILDQYQIAGGNTLWMVDQVQSSLDSLMQSGESLSFPNNLGLEDLFFSYGFRIQNKLIKDLYSSKIPLATGNSGKQTQYQLINWPFHNLALSGETDNIISSGLNWVDLAYSSPIELLNNSLEKTILLQSSDKVVTESSPGLISLNKLRKNKESDYNQGPFPLAILLEGQFRSAYEFRTKPFQSDAVLTAPGKLILISDGSIAENKFQNDRPVPLGTNLWTKEVFDNKNFLLNSIDYLCGEESILDLRNKKLVFAPLNKEKAFDEGVFWRYLNLLFPLGLLLLGFVLFNFFYRKNYI